MESSEAFQRLGIIGGSGIEVALATAFDITNEQSHDLDTPFGTPSGSIITADCGDVPIALLQRHGVGHVLNPTQVPYRANIYALKQLGCTHIVASGACGSLREHIQPGDLVVCDQLIDKTHRRAMTFYEHAAVHVEFADPFCSVLRQWLLDSASQLHGTNVHDDATYICMEGPSFSTRAESEMHRQWGADVVGMTALPEARLAREAEIAYALVALPTDYDCWRVRPRNDDGSAPDEHSLLSEIIGNLQAASTSFFELLKTALRDISTLRAQLSPAHDSLKLGIWSDKNAIDPTEIERLRTLWGRHF